MSVSVTTYYYGEANTKKVNNDPTFDVDSIKVIDRIYYYYYARNTFISFHL